MPHYSVHCADCKRELGEEFEQVHIWLDEFAVSMGPDHRLERHHVDGVEEARKKWGDRAARAAEIHILADCGKIPTMDSIILQKAIVGYGRKNY